MAKKEFRRERDVIFEQTFAEWQQGAKVWDSTPLPSAKPPIDAKDFLGRNRGERVIRYDK